MAWPQTLVLEPTGDVMYPKVVLRVAADGYRKGVGHGRGPWRHVMYRIEDRDQRDKDGHPVVGKSGHLSDLAIDFLIGKVQTVAAGAFTVAAYVQPHRHPGNTRLVCMNAEAEHSGVAKPDAIKMHETNYVSIRAEYEVPPWILDPAIDDPDSLTSLSGGPYPFMTVRTNRSFKTVQVPARSLKNPADPDAPITRTFELNIPIVTYSFRYNHLPFMGEEITNTLAYRTCNNAPIFGKAAETLRFDAPESEIANNTDGSRTNDVEFQLSWYPPGWNTVWPDGQSAPVPVTLQDGTKPYRPVDYSILLLTV